MSSRKEWKEDFEAHYEAKRGDNNFYNRDREYRKTGEKGREWKNHKYLYKKESPSGYMRYYYEVPSEIEGHNNIIGYYKDTGENEAAMRYGGDKRRELTNKDIEGIENRKKSIESLDVYINPENAIKGVKFLLKYGDPDFIASDIKHGAECVTDTLDAYKDEAVANLTGIKNDVKDFISGFFD